MNRIRPRIDDVQPATEKLIGLWFCFSQSDLSLMSHAMVRDIGRDNQMRECDLACIAMAVVFHWRFLAISGLLKY
jgi:hypothetical protein